MRSIRISLSIPTFQSMKENNKVWNFISQQLKWNKFLLTFPFLSVRRVRPRLSDN